MRKLDVQTQVYLAGLAIAVLFSLIFNAISMRVTGGGPMVEAMKLNLSVTVFDMGGNGKLAVLSAVAGIALWIWNLRSSKKEAWVPLALAGCAGGSALLFLILWLRAGTGSSGAMGIEAMVRMTMFGFWVPFAGALAAGVVSVRRIMNAKPTTAA